MSKLSFNESVRNAVQKHGHLSIARALGVRVPTIRAWEHDIAPHSASTPRFQSRLDQFLANNPQQTA